MSSILLWLRGYLLMALWIIYTAILSIVCITLNLLLHNRRVDDWVIGLWTRPFLRWAGIDVEVRGRENTPQQGCLFLFNHSSYLDIPVLYGYLPASARFGAKAELFRIPLFGAAMRRVGVLPIARQQRDQVLKVYEAAIERIKKGEKFLLAPEGTRQTIPHIGRFKTGPFIFAINAQMLIVPVVICGAQSLQPKGAWHINAKAWSSKVVLQVLPPIPTEGLTLESLTTIQNLTREKMIQTFESLSRELGEPFVPSTTQNPVS